MSSAVESSLGASLTGSYGVAAAYPDALCYLAGVARFLRHPEVAGSY